HCELEVRVAFSPHSLHADETLSFQRFRQYEDNYQVCPRIQLCDVGTDNMLCVPACLEAPNSIDDKAEAIELIRIHATDSATRTAPLECMPRELANSNGLVGMQMEKSFTSSDGLGRLQIDPETAVYCREIINTEFPGLPQYIPATARPPQILF